MNLNEIFNDYYMEIDENSDQAIEIFLELNTDGTKKYLNPIYSIFMHKTKNEMFIILDCTEMEIDVIEHTYKEWEKKFLSYINFGEEFKENKKFLKFNTTLILMCKDLPGEIDDLFRYQVEKSKVICRKLFILVDEENKIIKSNKAMVPFYFNSITSIKNEDVEKSEKKLLEALPTNKELLKVLEIENGSKEINYKSLLNWGEKVE